MVAQLEDGLQVFDTARPIAYIALSPLCHLLRWGLIWRMHGEGPIEETGSSKCSIVVLQDKHDETGQLLCAELSYEGMPIRTIYGKICLRRHRYAISHGLVPQV